MIIVHVLLQSEEEKKVKVSMARLLRYNRPEWPYLLVGLIVSAALGVSMPIFAVIMSALIALFFEVDEQKAKDETAMYAMLFVALGAASLVAGTVQVRLD
jgi:hypothetical protein